jgi:hypothetical protein
MYVSPLCSVQAGLPAGLFRAFLHPPPGGRSRDFRKFLKKFYPPPAGMPGRRVIYCGKGGEGVDDIEGRLTRAAYPQYPIVNR